MKQDFKRESPSSNTDLGSPSPVILLYTVYFIYFFCGLTQCFEGVFLPEFKEYFHLNYQQQQYIMFAKNIPFLLAVVIGMFVKRIGYTKCMTVAMLLFSAGTLALIPGLDARRYDLVLLAFLVIGIGFNFEIVAGNPMLSALGPAQASSSRLNLGNALGAVAQIIAPATLSIIIPVTVVSVRAKIPYMNGIFAALGTVLFVVAIFTMLTRKIDVAASFQQDAGTLAADEKPASIWRRPRVVLGFVSIFLILGVEAGLFGFYRNYLEDPAIAGLTSHQSQRLFTLYFAVFAAGRLAASWIQKRIRPSTHLAVNLFGAMACLAVVAFAKGTAAVVAVTLIGFFVSIFFPTLYALAIKNLGDLTGPASGLLTMGFVGCALIPVLQGRIADAVGLQYSYVIGLAGYLFASFYTLSVAGDRNWIRK
jgi:FHS family L-fucose permease-like MFS transporter